MSTVALPAAQDVQPCIQHVFVLMLENRSFDHLFARSGIPGIVAASAENTNAFQGEIFAFGSSAPDPMPTDPGHEFSDVVEQLCGPGVSFPKGGPYPPISNSGFVSNYATTTTEGVKPQPADVGDIMLGVDTANQVPTLYGLAKEFVLCDGWHASMPGPTWPNRYFIHGASSSGLDHSPTSGEMGEWEAVDGFTFTNGSIFDALDRLGKDKYRLYQDDSGPLLGRVPQVASLRGVSFFDVNNLSDLEADLAADYTAAYTFIEPAYGDIAHSTYEGGSSQHPMDGLDGGDQLARKVYNAIRSSPVWDSSLLLIVYDEHGGFYDSVPPGAAPPPNDGQDQPLNANRFGFDVYGVRVPAIVVSPWVGQGQIDHTVRDHTSLLATLEHLFNLPPLTGRDGKASDLLSLLKPTRRIDCTSRM